MVVKIPWAKVRGDNIKIEEQSNEESLPREQPEQPAALPSKRAVDDEQIELHQPAQKRLRIEEKKSDQQEEEEEAPSEAIEESTTEQQPFVVYNYRDDLPSFSNPKREENNNAKTDQAESNKEGSQKKNCRAKITIEAETDGQWMYCKEKNCSFWTRKQVRMERHEKSHVPGDDKFYQCPECQLKICSLSKLLRHDRKFHTGYKDYECKICEAEVTDIAVHMRVSFFRL